jgi:AraC-like DNA-binding protein
MEDKSHLYVNNLLYSYVTEKQRDDEQFVHEHALGYVIAGETHLLTNNGLWVVPPGSIGLARRNQLVKSIKVPAPGGEYKAMKCFLTQELLRNYANEHKIDAVGCYTGDSMRALPSDPFLIGYFNSLLPYFTQNVTPSESMSELKTKEVVELLLRIDPSLKYLLFDFSEPHKIDLEAYMNKNYMYNVPAVQFAKLTGRSLAGFKRDFEKIFQTSPGHWLQKKRLDEAFFLIKEKGRKPSDVYLDVGFENLSHFSRSFKQAFGVAPSMV